MKVVEHLALAKNPHISVEIIPPKRGSNIHQLHKAIESVLPYKPAFIDITSHAAEAILEEMPDGTIKRRTKRKSPGTFGLCAAIKYKYNVDPVPHLLCNGFTREETEDALIELNYLGVENLLLIRGDGQPRRDQVGRTVNNHALDLVKQVANMNKGIYQDTLIDAYPSNFCIGVAAYPEKHFESPNLNFDIDNLLAKQNAGAEYAVCQMFFSNQYYFDFVEQARKKGVTIPILPGLKILTSKKQLHSIPRSFFVNLPEELVSDILNATNDKTVLEIGINWAYHQSLGLLEAGLKNLHFYIMQNTSPFISLMSKLSSKL
ncbi:MAG: methylenetetrahydrofolate reductase [Bacteroidia bacterium]|nr:methylenetetrahydrofolate reductase [Bacteroidia bacterium]